MRARGAGSARPSGTDAARRPRRFWKDYPNIYHLVTDELGLKEDDVFTPYLGSAFYSPDGLEATAPVFGDAPELPSPFGQVLATFENFKRLPVADRVTMGGLLAAILDLYRDEATFEAYDRMTAAELFRRCGLSDRLVDEFVAPTLRVGLFKDPSELSAAVSMELLYYYALAHQTSFDVRWIKRGSIAESIIAPLAERLIARHGLVVRGGCRVAGVDLDGGAATGVRFTDYSGGTPSEEALEGLDGVVLALGSKGMAGVMKGSEALAAAAPELVRAGQLGGIDVAACRLWLDRRVPTLEPANVFSRFPSLRGAGGTYFMLDQLQQDSERELWAGEEPQGSVLACDFYGADRLLAELPEDEDVVKLLVEELLPAAEPAFRGVNVVDAEVRRYPGAVSWFSPGSFASRPPLETAVSNVVCAGDWVRMGDREHGSKGLCQERAFVSGMEAANALMRNGSLGQAGRDAQPYPVLPVRDDEPQVVAGRELNKLFADAVAPLGLRPPWLA